MEYPLGFKARMVQRMTGPEAITATALYEETGVAQSTLSRWKNQAGSILAMANKSDPNKHKQPPHTRPAEEKLRLVMAADPLPGDELGAFLRKEGIHESHLEALAERHPGSPQRHQEGVEEGQEGVVVRGQADQGPGAGVEAQGEGAGGGSRAAGAEKKVRDIWGDGDDGTGGRSGR